MSWFIFVSKTTKKGNRLSLQNGDMKMCYGPTKNCHGLLLGCGNFL